MTDLRDFRMPELPLARATTAGALADRLVATTCDRLAELETSTAPGLVLPSIHAGHVVGDDAAGDLLYVLGLLVECGVEQVAGVDLRSRILTTLERLDPVAVEAFASYRVAETVLRIGGLAAVPAALHDTVLEAATSPKTLAMLENGADIPPNFAVVGARCLRGVARLRGEDGADDAAFVERVRTMFGTGEGWIDDGMGAWVQYDIYTPDVYLFAEPLRDHIGEPWRQGLDRVLADLDDLAQPGGAVVWGRSIGALGLAMTIELAGLAVGHEVGDNRDRWIARAAAALDELEHWFPAGVIAAHQGRATMFYRGPHRRLQMTLDVYGKLLLAAIELRRHPEIAGAPPAAAWPSLDRLITFDPDRPAAVWTVRSTSLRCALPLLVGFSTDYAPSPRAPGLFEQPTSGHPVMLPVITGAPRSSLDGDDAVTVIPAGLPVSIEHQPGRLTISHRGWAPCGNDANHRAGVAGARTATYRVDGRTLHVDESLTFDDDDLPGPLSVTVAERSERPLRVSVEGGDAGPVQVIDTTGVAEWRSFWGEAARVHQFEIPAARSIDLTWSVTPVLRVASTMYGHQYDRSLYDPIRDRLVTRSAKIPDEQLIRRLDDMDVLHMAWPEWWAGTDPERNRTVIDQVRSSGTTVVWTQHNLLPHGIKDDDARATYQLWAEAADTVIHHTEIGRRVAMDTYRYGADTVHTVIPHGHWGAHLAGFAGAARDEVERDEGWAPCALRLAVVGAPRDEKDLQLVVDAVAASRRADVQLLIRSEDAVELPDDPRIIAEDRHLSDGRYARRLAAFDALVLPFAPHGMLTTGTAFDSIGAGIPAITSDWGFFDETFDGADIRYGTTAEDLTRCIDGLTPEDLERARSATVARRPHFEWVDIAERTLAVLEAAATRVAERDQAQVAGDGRSEP